MRHFIFEFITGGGLVGQDLPESLQKEGELMLQTLANELTRLNVDLSVSRDSRLAKLDKHIKQYVIDNNIDKELNHIIKHVDVCWLIAPETEQCMEYYAGLLTNEKTLFVGSTVDAISLTGSKYLTNKLLLENDVAAVETRRLDEMMPEADAGWIVKPDDGAGAENARLIKSKDKLDLFIENQGNKNFIIQPYIEGKHMSISLLVYEGDVCLLGCNQQYVDVNEDGIKLEKIGVNEHLAYKDEMLKLAKKIVSVIPGLAGYIGIDLIENNGKLIVLEINPRFTTAYAGLPESLGCNIAEKILDAFISKKLPDIKLDSAKPVIVNV